MADTLPLLIGAILANNFVLTQLLGRCPFIGPKGRIDGVLPVGIVTAAVLIPATVATVLFDRFMLVPYQLEYLRLVIFMVIVAAFVQFAGSVIRARHPSFLQALHIYRPLIATNCVILGTAWLTPNIRLDLLETVGYTLGASATFTLIVAMFAALYARLNDAQIPRPFRGAPILLISIGLMSLAFMGFKGVGG